jgi:hypothetical protein
MIAFERLLPYAPKGVVTVPCPRRHEPNLHSLRVVQAPGRLHVTTASGQKEKHREPLMELLCRPLGQGPREDGFLAPGEPDLVVCWRVERPPFNA